jgi:hypothetical protein
MSVQAASFSTEQADARRRGDVEILQETTRKSGGFPVVFYIVRYDQSAKLSLI